MPDSGAESWTVLGDDHAPVEPVERWLAYLTVIERSPNTIKGYAHDLKDWFGFLQQRDLDWRRVQLEDLGGFLAWLRPPPEARGGRVLVLPSVERHCSQASVNRKLSALAGFYQFHARHGVEGCELLIGLRPGGRQGGSWRPLLYHLAKHQPQRRRTVKLPAPKRQPRVLTARQVQAILDACDHLRDRLLFAVLFDSGMRIGEALGLRHEDLAIAERQVRVTRGSTTTGPGSRAGCRGRSRSAQSCCGCTPTTCTANTASWTPTMCSSTCGADPVGSRWPTRRSMTWWVGCADAPRSDSGRTNSATPMRPGCCATAPAWKP
jgi:site-specific recombinase XerC